MKMNKRNDCYKGSVILLALSLALGGCGIGSNRVGNESKGSSGQLGQNMGAETELETEAVRTERYGMMFDYQVNPEDFSLSLKKGDSEIAVSGGVGTRVVADYQEKDDGISWRYPDEQLAVSIKPVDDYLSVTITSETDHDNTFTWPNVSADAYYLPLGEGKRIPAGDAVWQNYLNGQEFSAMEQLSMPFWITDAGDYSVLYIMEHPYRTQLDFSSNPNISFSVSHRYPEIDAEKEKRFRIYLTDNNPVSGAKLYRTYVNQQGRFRTLEQKAAQNPNIRKLYGVPFVYLWGDFVISADDINWPLFRKSLSSGVIEYLLTFANTQENGAEFTQTIQQLKLQDYVDVYQKNIICGYISQLLKRDDFWNSSVFPASASLKELLKNGYENLTESQKIQVNKQALAESLPDVFADAAQWMNASTVDLLRSMQEHGIDRAWIGLNSWEQAYAKPELVETANEQGYLTASYDSYHSIHEPGNEQWITAKFPDTSLYENASVTNQNGEKEAGFKNVGRKLNPVLSLPSVRERMETIMSNDISFNSWFIDCDATGEIYDDYTSGHVTTQEEDLQARLERMSYIRDHYQLVTGSEGGNDFAASTIAYAHGIELKSFSWMDDDMKNNRESEYYIGKYYNPDGGVVEHFSKVIPLKDHLYTIFVDPRYDVPLYKLVYNDSVITAAHWDWSTFKIQGAVQDRMVREILYNVPPLYHLDENEWEKYQDAIAAHHSVWSEFSRQAVLLEMTDFESVTPDGSVQKTVYGSELTAVANFGDSAFLYEGFEIPGHAVLIANGEESLIYVPAPEND